MRRSGNKHGNLVGKYYLKTSVYATKPMICGKIRVYEEFTREISLLSGENN